MRYRIVSFIICLLVATTSLAQNWELFPAGQRNVYISTEQGSNHLVYAYQADSFKVTGSDTMYFFNQKPFGANDPYCYSHFESDYDFSLYHDPFQMDSIALIGNHYEINIAGTMVKFLHQANLNQSWTVNAPPNAGSIDHVLITCSSIDEEIIFGMIDTVKTFSLTAYNNNQVIPEFSSYQYKLAKSFGLIEFIPFKNLVTDDYAQEGLARLTLQRMEIGGQVYGFSFPTFEDYFSHYQSGDVLVWSNTVDWWDIMVPTIGEIHRDSFISVTQTTDSVCMCGHRTRRVFTVGLNDTVYSTINFSQCFVRSQFEPFLQLGTGQSTFAVNDLGQGYGGIGVWEVTEISIDSTDVIPVFSIHTRYVWYLDTFTCEIKAPYDFGADFRINTSEGLQFYGEYGWNIDTTGLISYIPGTGIAGDCIGVNVLSLNGGADLSIAPTLATDFIQIKSSDPGKISVSLYSIQGKFLQHTKMHSSDDLDIRFLPDGNYIIRVVVKDKVFTSKFMKYTPH